MNERAKARRGMPVKPWSGQGTLFVTGATGLLGGEALARILEGAPDLRAVALVRGMARWRRAARHHGFDARRVTALPGDLRLPGLGLPASLRDHLATSVTSVLHAGADVIFSRTLDDSRASNVEGTRNLLEVADGWPAVERFVHVSTAFVAGRRTGWIPEEEPERAWARASAEGWVNAYERSKWEAEQEVRAARRDWTILRPASVVFDLTRRGVTQFNAAHQALRLFRRGLVPMLPGRPETPVDLVPADWVAERLARAVIGPSLPGRTFQLCAGRGAMPLEELLATTWSVWREEAAWRRRGIPEPALVDGQTYALFHRSVEQTADEGLKRAAETLGHFAPQLALPKRFDTRGAEAALGGAAPPVASYWRALLEHLHALDWGFRAIGAAA